MITIGSLLDETNHLPGETSIHLTCMERDYVVLHPHEVESTFIASVGDGDILFGFDCQTNKTLSLQELKTLMDKELLSLDTRLMVEEEFGDNDMRDILVLEDRIILI